MLVLASRQNGLRLDCAFWERRLLAETNFSASVSSVARIIPELFRIVLWLIFLGTSLPEQEDIGIGGLAVLLGASRANTVAGIIVDAEENGLARTPARGRRNLE